MHHALASSWHRTLLAAAVLALISALLLTAPAAAPAVASTLPTSPDGQVLVVAANAKQGTLDEGRLAQLASGMVTRTPQLPDAIIMTEIGRPNLRILRDMLNAQVPPESAVYELVGTTANNELEGDTSLEARILLNTVTMQYGKNTTWTDVCTTERTYQLITAQEKLAGGALGRAVALAGVHFAPSFKAGGSIPCKQQNADESRRQMAAYADSGIMGDFNRRATTQYYDCNPHELGEFEPWYETMTGPSATDGRIYRDTVRATHFGTESMPLQWSLETMAQMTLCDGTTDYKRTRLDYIFVSDEMAPITAGTDQGWGTGARGEAACDPAPECKYSDHRFVWASVAVSPAATLARPGNLAAIANAAGGIDLTWSKVKGAGGYDVYRYNPDPAVRNWAKIGTTSTPSYSDPATGLQAGTATHYRVIATASGSTSRPSLLASATPTTVTTSDTSDTSTTEPAAPVTTITDDLASAETTTTGALTSGDSYRDTHADDGDLETIKEVASGNKKNATQALEHRWTFQVTGGDTVTLNADAQSSGAEGFRFEYSTNGGRSFSPLFTVTDSNLYSQALTVSPGATVIVRAVDTVRTTSDTTVEAISVDHLFIRSTTTA